MLLVPHSGTALDNSKSLVQYNCRSWKRENGLPVNGIRAVAQGRDGHLWLGTQKGLVKFDGFNFSIVSLPPHPGWRNRTVTAIATAPSGQIWFGMYTGSIGILDPEQGFVNPNETWIEPRMGVSTISFGREGSAWIGSGIGPIRWSGRPGDEPGLYTNLWNTTAIHTDSTGRTWVGTAEKGLFVWDQGSMREFADTNLNKESIYAVTTDQQQNLWVGTHLGLRRFEASHAPIETMLPYEEVRALYTDRQGAVWIGTSGNGLHRFYNGRMDVLRRTNGLADNFVNVIYEDREGSIWLGTREGLSQLSDVKFPIFGPDSGLVGGASHAVAPSRSGGIWVASAQGISRFHETNVQTGRGPPPPCRCGTRSIRPACGALGPRR